jgi:hypothetical protein
MGQDVLSLFNAIGSGDSATAKIAYNSLSNMLGTSDSSSSSSSSASSSEDNTFSSLLSEIGTALDNNDISSAQSALENFRSGF